MLNELLVSFSELEDPRCDYKVEHNLLDILVITICAVIACAESWEDIALYARSKEAWLRGFLELKNGIPSHDTFRRVFTLINAKDFEHCFLKWIGQWLGTQPDCIAIDGKTMRHSFDNKRNLSPIHLVSAWAGENRFSLGQVAVGSKSNEIKAIPELLANLDLRGSLVTLDAMGCQKEIAQNIVDKKAQYVLALKGNHKKTFQLVSDWFESKAFRKPFRLKPAQDAVEETHGRLQWRQVFISPIPPEWPILQEWPGLKTIVCVKSLRRNYSEFETTAEKRYFLSSADASDSRLARSIQQHWSIENSLHWVLDVTFGEDNSRIRDRNAAQNLALIRKIAINLIQKCPIKGSVRGRRKKAAWDDDYMAKLLA